MKNLFRGVLLFSILALLFAPQVEAQTKFMQNIQLITLDSVCINMSEVRIVTRLSNGKAKIILASNSGAAFSGTRTLDTESTYGSILTASGGNLVSFVRFDGVDTSSIAINPKYVDRVAKDVTNTRTPILLKDRLGTFLVNGNFALTTSRLASNRGLETLTGSASLNFPSTLSTAVADLTISVPGAAVGDAIDLGVPNASITATANFFAWVSAANTVTVRYSPKATEDPAVGTFKVIISKS